MALYEVNPRRGRSAGMKVLAKGRLSAKVSDGDTISTGLSNVDSAIVTPTGADQYLVTISAISTGTLTIGVRKVSKSSTSTASSVSTDVDWIAIGDAH